MPRDTKRKLRLTDVIERFEGRSHAERFRNARGIIGRLKEEGSKLWCDESSQFIRWTEGCDEMREIIDSLGKRRYKEEPLETVMREFIHEFEHTAGRMHQMLYGSSNDSDTAKNIVPWFEIVFRAMTYAIVAAWIDEIHVPRKYRKATKRI